MGRGRASRRKEARPCGPQPLLGTGSTAERPPARPRPGHTSPRLHDELHPSAEAATRCAAGSLPPPRTAGKRLVASRLLPGPFLLFLLRPGTSFLLCKTHALRGGREGGRWGGRGRERDQCRPQSTFRRETLPLSRELPRAQRDPSAASAAASVCFCLWPRLALAVALLAVTQVSPAGEAPAPFTAHTTAIDRPGVRVQLHCDRPEGDADLNVHPHEEVQTVPEDGRPRGQTAAPPTARRLLWGPKFIWKHLDIRFGRGPRS